MNTRISTEADLLASDDAMMMILWEELCLNAQGFEVKDNTMIQDNKRRNNFVEEWK